MLFERWCNILIYHKPAELSEPAYLYQLLKISNTKSIRYRFSFIILTGMSEVWEAFLPLNFFLLSDKMKTKFRLAFFSHFLIYRDDILMMFVFLYCYQYWIYGKIHVQQEVLSWDIEILNNIAVIKMSVISVSEPRISPFPAKFTIFWGLFYKGGAVWLISKIFCYQLWVLDLNSRNSFFTFRKRVPYKLSCIVFHKHFGNYHSYLWEDHYVF